MTFFARDYVALALAAVLILGPMAAGVLNTGAAGSSQPAAGSAASDPGVRPGNPPITVPGPGRP